MYETQSVHEPLNYWVNGRKSGEKGEEIFVPLLFPPFDYPAFIFTLNMQTFLYYVAMNIQNLSA